MIDNEEQMNSILDKAIFRFVKETDKYKALNKRFDAINYLPTPAWVRHTY